MKQLIWKELREQRYIPIAYGVLLIAVVTVCYGIQRWESLHGMQGAAAFNPVSQSVIVVIGLAMAGWFSGSSAVAPEQGSGTLGFLLTLPGGRARLWLAKISAGLIVTFLSMVAVVLSFVLIMLVLYGAHGTSLAGVFMSSNPTLAPMLFISAIYLYAVTLYASTFVDRSLVAAILGLIGGLAVLAVMGQMETGLGLPVTSSSIQSYVTTASIAYLAVIFFGASYITFCTGPVLGSGRRREQSFTLAFVMLLIGGLLVRGYADYAIAAYVAEPHVATWINQPGRYWSTTYVQVQFDREIPSSRKMTLFLTNRSSILVQSTGARRLDNVVTRNPDAPAAFVEPVAVRGDDPYAQANLRAGNRIEITMSRHPRPGSYTDILDILGAHGEVLGEIDVENVTQ